MQKPVQDGDSFVVTPGGPRLRSKVHLATEKTVRQLSEKFRPGPPKQGVRKHSATVEKAKMSSATEELRAEMEIDKLQTAVTNDVPNWITYAGCWNTSGTTITKFTSRWRVPNDPTSHATQLLYFFNGIETSDGRTIVQPVLQWGGVEPDSDGVLRVGRYWTVASWIVGGIEGDALHSQHVRVNAGDELVGIVSLIDQPNGAFVYQCEFEGIPQSAIPTPPLPELMWCVEVLEAYELRPGMVAPYDLDSESEYPASRPVTFESIVMETVAPSPDGQWMTQNVVHNYSENTQILQNSVHGGEVQIMY